MPPAEDKMTERARLRGGAEAVGGRSEVREIDDRRQIKKDKRPCSLSPAVTDARTLLDFVPQTLSLFFIRSLIDKNAEMNAARLFFLPT